MMTFLFHSRLLRASFLMAALLLASGASARESASRNRQLVDRYVAAWNAHDPSGAGALLADDARYYDIAAGKDVAGRAKVREILSGLISILPDLHWTVRGSPQSGPKGVAFEWDVAGTYLPEGAEHTKAVPIHGATFITIADGKIVRVADYYDRDTMRRQLKS